MTTGSVEDRQLLALREKIDLIDGELFKLFADRMAIVRQIGALKQEYGLPLKDPVREAVLKTRLKDSAADVLEPRHVEQLARAIIEISRDIQEETNT
ncbi:MAG: chorismate mutase [Candidatus Marinimicrobia bacterium]|nr:chorismate mutase [Candidatus Neomarinimicrobiota bacterium]